MARGGLGEREEADRDTRVAALSRAAPYERLLLDSLLELPGLTDVRSNIAIRTSKEDGPLPIA